MMEEQCDNNLWVVAWQEGIQLNFLHMFSHCSDPLGFIRGLAVCSEEDVFFSFLYRTHRKLSEHYLADKPDLGYIVDLDEIHALPLSHCSIYDLYLYLMICHWLICYGYFQSGHLKSFCAFIYIYHDENKRPDNITLLSEPTALFDERTFLPSHPQFNVDNASHLICAHSNFIRNFSENENQLPARIFRDILFGFMVALYKKITECPDITGMEFDPRNTILWKCLDNFWNYKPLELKFDEEGNEH
jgi:hypothetical protein